MVELPETVANPLLRVLLLVPRDQDSGTRGSFGRWSQTTWVGAEVGARTRGGQAACSHASASRLSLWAPGAWSPWGTLGVRDHGPLPGHSFRRPRELGRRSSTSCRSRDAGCLRLRRLRWGVKKGAGTQAKSAGLKAPKLRASQEHGPSATRDGIHQRTQTRHAFLVAPSLSVLLFPSEHLARAYKSFICGFCQFPISPHKCARLGAEGLSFPTISLAGRGIEHGPRHGHILKDM